ELNSPDRHYRRGFGLMQLVIGTRILRRRFAYTTKYEAHSSVCGTSTLAWGSGLRSGGGPLVVPHPVPGGRCAAGTRGGERGLPESGRVCRRQDGDVRTEGGGHGRVPPERQVRDAADRQRTVQPRPGARRHGGESRAQRSYDERARGRRIGR